MAVEDTSSLLPLLVYRLLPRASILWDYEHQSMISWPTGGPTLFSYNSHLYPVTLSS